MVECLPPVIDSRARILILGTMPSVISLDKQRYYANPNNQFWRLIYGVFGEEPDTEYTDRIGFIGSKGIALWDVLKACTREGSADADIEDEEPNNLPLLLKNYPNIKSIACNGQTASKLLLRYFKTGFPNVIIINPALPSSSPTPGRNVLNFEGKLKRWKIIQKWCEK